MPRTFSPFVLISALCLASPASVAQSQPRYLGPMQSELQAMGLRPQCTSATPQAGSGTVRAGAAPDARSAARSARQFVLVLQYNDNTDTIYVYTDHYARLPADRPAAPQAFRRLLEMNWETLVAHFEWSSETGDIRLAAVINTDSNFDRRAFRGVVRSVLRLADRYADEISRLTGAPVGES
jgi:hypothetical protein